MSASNVTFVTVFPDIASFSSVNIYIPRRKSGIYWIQVRRAAAAAAAAVEISLWTR